MRLGGKQALLVMTLCALVPQAGAQTCAPDDVDCLLAQGRQLLAQRSYEAAYLVFERAAFVAPDNASVQLGLGLVLQRLGVRDPEMPAATAAQPVQRLETGLGYSNNRNRLPSLSHLRLSLPDLGQADFPLADPLRPDAGPIAWLNYTRLSADGTRWQLGMNRAADQHLGTAWLRVEGELAGVAGGFWRVEHVRRLENGWQSNVAGRYRQYTQGGAVLDWEAGLRREYSGRPYDFLDFRAGWQQPTPVGILGLALQRQQPLGSKPPGEGQWRLSASLSHLWQAGGNQFAVLGMLSHAIDDATYHPYLAQGKPRWQNAAILTLGFERPLGGGLGLWGRLYAEKLRSNVPLFVYHRVESLLGLAYEW